MSKGSLWQQLENTLKTKIDEFDGVAGVSLKSFSSGKHISINGDEIFPTASTIKIHILAKLFYLEEKGEIDLSERIRFTQDKYGGGSGVIHFWRTIQNSLFWM